MATKYIDVADYMKSLSGEALVRVQLLRETVHTIMPEAEEAISYNIPAFFVPKKDTKHSLMKRNIVYLSGYAHHIGLYPAFINDTSLNERLVPYRSGKSTLKFPQQEPLPMKLIEEFIHTRIAEIGA
jgi:uncharacterized protein YdhG (YjbR/CyaY superfamily)